MADSVLNLADAALLDRALGAYLGLAIGDALGATVEFLTPAEIQSRYGTHQRMIGGGWLRLAPGQVTDDTQMSLALGSALVTAGHWDLVAIAEAFVAWMRSGPPDIGNTCRRGICHYLSTGDLSVPPSRDSGSNGAAMRNLPVVLASLADEETLIRRSLEQAHLTHHHPLADAGTTALACMTRRLILAGASAPVTEMARQLVAQHREFEFRPWPGRSGGYIVDTLQTVFDGFFNTGSFADCLVRVVNRGGDADTTGALAGQLAGAFYGLEGIPAAWLKVLDPFVHHTIYEQTLRLLELSSRMTSDRVCG